ncbi:hypothetical protein OG21DRAFT_1478756 [Imleria badia]|nr:hypothetical protein OG21DRAFT_1478756 [Imleria badia]
MLAHITKLANQLRELHLIQCSLLPGERFTFVLPPQDLAIWSSLLDAFTDADDQDARFEIHVVGTQTWFEVVLPLCTDVTDFAPGTAINVATWVTISVKGEHVSRDAHERWNAEIRSRTAEIDEGCAFPVYELLIQLTASLHQSRSPSPLSSPAPSSTPITAAQPLYHALLTSHHLISPTKRRTMQQLSSQLGITGFAKVGYPGIMYAEGPQEAVEAFVRDVKGMQWLALRVRFVEPISDSDLDYGVTRDQDVRWVEVSKIGEVLEQMRIRGREDLVTNLGIGAPSIKELKR